MAELRESTLLASGVVMYAVAYACFLGRRRADISTAQSLDVIRENVAFGRPTRIPSEHDPLRRDEVTDFAVGLIDPVSGNITSGRENWEHAGRKLFRVVVGDEAYVEHFPANGT